LMSLDLVYINLLRIYVVKLGFYIM
jgi:hypothetical protein